MSGSVVGLMSTMLVALLTAIAWREARRIGDAGSMKSRLYWIVAGATIAVAVAVGAQRGLAVGARIAPALAAGGVSAYTDATTGYIFDRVLLAANALGIAAALIEGAFRSSAFGAAIAAALPLALFVVSRGRGIGFGDVKLAATLGSIQTPIGALWTVALACGTAGSLAAILVLAGRRRWRDTIAFGPFLTLGACLAVVGGGVN